jgi:hypothetical protein
MPDGDAAAAAMAPALVSAKARAAIAAVRLPLHRGGSTGAAATGAYGASRGTVSWIGARGACGRGTVGGEAGGTVNPGGGEPGGWAVTTSG